MIFIILVSGVQKHYNVKTKGDVRFFKLTDRKAKLDLPWLYMSSFSFGCLARHIIQGNEAGINDEFDSQRINIIHVVAW